MDHLATRMRRNSENLLVLAGHDMTRRWTQAVSLVDVVRAAVSEIEQYERVTLDVQPGISVRGHAVNDVVHLLSELVENATSFSAGETQVSVSAHLLNGGGVLFAISDQGVGMGAEEMARANWRLDNPPVVDVAVSRRMGLFVVARLAARHGIRVRLRPASVKGITSLVWLPNDVISHEAASTSGPRWPDPPGPAGPAMPAMRPRPADWPATGQPDQPSAALEAPTATSAMPSFGGQSGPVREGVIVPLAVSAGEEIRLPIFESVESDWFGHRRNGAAGSAPMTVAGLPTRVPKANLIPGSVGAVLVSPRPALARSAVQARERLASFQRGVREGRAAASDDEISSGADDSDR
jgi:anti-sigma regulatory factor (Ser/Thr protein kinase)